VHEAICSGVPAIVSSAAGIAERFPPEFRELLLDDCDSAEELCTRFRRWRAEADEFRRRTQAFGAQLRTRSWDDMSREIADTSTS
jgi:hypothetical protein